MKKKKKPSRLQSHRLPEDPTETPVDDDESTAHGERIAPPPIECLTSRARAPSAHTRAFLPVMKTNTAAHASVYHTRKHSRRRRVLFPFFFYLFFFSITSVTRRILCNGNNYAPKRNIFRNDDKLYRSLPKLTRPPAGDPFNSLPLEKIAIDFRRSSRRVFLGLRR